MLATVIASIVYAAAMIAANLIVFAVGPWVSPINAFFLIGLDLTMRDWLHARISAWQMLGLIAATSILTYLLNPAAGMIAVASATAFSAAALVDWATFSRLKGTWLFRANGSNIAGAAVDSIPFPTIAFGALLPHIVALQFVAKVAGGALWAWIIKSAFSSGTDASMTK